MKNSIFKFTIPKDFILSIDTQTRVRLEDSIEKYEHQPAYMDINMMHIETIAGLNGDSFLDKYIAWSEGFQSEVVTSTKTKHHQYTAYRVEAKTDTVYQEKHFKIQYINLCILLDDTWCVEYQFVYETHKDSLYKSIAENTLQSLQILKTADTWAQAHMADIREATFAYKASLQEEIEEKPKTTNAPFQIPKDQQQYIKIGNFDFEFIEEDCESNTVEFSKKFQVSLKAKTSQAGKAKEKELLEHHYSLEEGEIVLSIGFTGIYKDGIPTGEFTFEESKTGDPHYIHFNAKGIRLDFYGNITLQDGWIGIQGQLKKSYQDKPSFPITVFKKISTENIDWSLYQFNLKEAKQIAPETVQYLWMKENDSSHFPNEILTFKNLKTLTIQANASYFLNAKALSLDKVSENIGQLKELVALTIINTTLKKLPESLGALKQLETLHLHNNELEELPAGIFQLPKLKYLWVSKNNIASIANKIDLPALQNIDLKNNQITTLPESLATQPSLEGIKLTGNPLQSLPEAFNNIPMEMDIDDKRRLLNYEYQGADGKGIVQWDNEAYLAKNNPHLQQLFLNAIKNTTFKKYQNPLEKLALHAVCLKTIEKDTYNSIGNTRFGGLPDLPQGIDYPSRFSEYDKETYHYIFIAQLNCEELAPYQEYLPRTGMLYFYLENEEDFSCKVMYHPELNKLQSAKQLDAEQLNIFDSEEPYNPYKATPSNFVALPSFYNDDYWYKVADAPELDNLEDYDHEDYNAPGETVHDNFRKALGKKGKYQEWNNCYYPDSHHSCNDYVFTQHESPQEQAALKHKGNPEDWVVLLKVHSDTNCGFCFWDAGELFFVIHKSDLAKGNFSNVYTSIESS